MPIPNHPPKTHHPSFFTLNLTPSILHSQSSILHSSSFNFQPYSRGRSLTSKKPFLYTTVFTLSSVVHNLVRILPSTTGMLFFECSQKFTKAIILWTSLLIRSWASLYLYCEIVIMSQTNSKITITDNNRNNE